MSNITAAGESLDPGNEVILFKIDLTTIGYPTILFFTPSRQDGGTLWFKGDEYESRPIQATGFDKSSDSAPPEPVLLMGNADKGGHALLKQYNDLINAKVTRYRTHSRFLDKLPNGDVNPDSDPTAHYLPEIWYIEQKEGSDHLQIKWRLSSSLDLSGKKVPARTMLKNVCRRPYRFWDAEAGQWIYPNTPNACPYAGAAMFTLEGAVTNDPMQDRCAKNYGNGCTKRYGRETLPAWFFPGLKRYPR